MQNAAETRSKAHNTSVAEDLRAAARHLTDGNRDMAAIRYRELLRRFPGNQRAKAALAAIEADPPVLPQGDTPRQRDQIEQLFAAVQTGDHAAMRSLGDALVADFPVSAMLHNILCVAHGAVGNWGRAISSARTALDIRPDFVEGAFNLASSCQGAGKLAEAVAAYGHVLRLDPKNAAAWNNLGVVLQDLSDHEGAVAAFTKAAECNPNLAEVFQNRGIALKSSGQLAAAIGDFQTALGLDPKAILVYRHAADAMKSLGESAAAAACLTEALKIAPGDAECVEALARVADNQQVAMVRGAADKILSGAGPNSDDAMRAHYALATLDLRADTFETAMAHLVQAGGIGKRRTGFSIKTEEAIFQASTRPFAGPVDGPKAHGDMRPIFILGMPRSGTSLVEEILAAHSNVTGGGELESFRRAMVEADCFDCDLTADLLDQVRANYLSEVKRRLGEGTQVFTDKMPFNFRVLGHIATALPEARILHVTRPAEAVGWSNYRTHFASSGMAYSFDQRDIARMCRLHDAYMAFWRDQFPDRIISVDYDALTEDPEGQARRLLEALGLAWDPEVLAFHENMRAVRTVSATQVRQAIYTGSSEAWRAVKPWLGPMLDELQIYQPPDAPGG